MPHSLLHQIAVSDLVTPVMIAEYGDMVTTTAKAVRLGPATWLAPDLAVHCAAQGHDGFVDGPPLLVAEVASAASRTFDLGAKKDAYARAGVPCYWVVDVSGPDVRMHVFELAAGAYAERAVLDPGGAARITEPFKIEIRPEVLFPGLPAWRGPVKGADMYDNGPDLPSADTAFAADSFARRWPTGAEKAELLDGTPVFYGIWDERDVEIARRAYPGRVVRLDQQPGRPGTLRVLPSGADVHDEDHDPEDMTRTAAIRIMVPGEF